MLDWHQFFSRFTCYCYIMHRATSSCHLSILYTVSDMACFYRLLCDETKEHTAEILIPHERVITLVFWYQKMSVGDVPFHPKFAFKVTHPSVKNACFNQYAHNVSTVRASEKCSSIARLPIRYNWTEYVTHNFNRIKSATKFLCVKTFSAKLVVEPIPYLTVYRGWRQT